MKEGYYVEFDYILYDENNKIIDTTIEQIAKENNIYSEKIKYKPLSIILGEGHTLKGLEKSILNSNKTEFEVVLEPKDAFGEYKKELLVLLPEKIFREKGITPLPNLVVKFGNEIGIVKSISGGRVLVDFNHPLAGKKVKFKVFIRKVLNPKENKEEALKLILKNIFGIKEEDYDYNLENDVLTLELKKYIESSIIKNISEKLKKWLDLKDIKVIYNF